MFSANELKLLRHYDISEPLLTGEHLGSPYAIYKIAVDNAFLLNRQDVFDEVLRKVYQALQDCKVYRDTPEFEKLFEGLDNDHPVFDLLAWATALESGEYEQGRTMLCSVDHRYCCLGVLCEINKIPKTLAECFFPPKYEYVEDNVGYRTHLPPSLNQIGDLNKKVKVAGKRWIDRFLADSQFGFIDNFAKLNDKTNLTFNEIARIIRIQFLGENLPYPDGVEEAI